MEAPGPRPSPSPPYTPALLPDITSIGPSTMAQRESGLLPPSRWSTTYTQFLIETLHRQAFGFRPSYSGDVLNPSNRPDQVLPHRNCNLWITNLPACCTESDLEDALANTGAIFAMSLNPPDTSSGHAGSAASVAFMRTESAKSLIKKARWEGFWVKGQRARVVWNRNRIGPQVPGFRYSRVLVIKGPREVVNQEILGEFFGRYCSYRTTGVEFLGSEDNVGDGDGEQEDGRRVVLEWRFARVTGQANIAASCLRALRDEHDIAIDFSWGVDPCE